MSQGREIFIAGTSDDVAREAAARFVALASEAIGLRGRFSVLLSGGSTPRKLYSLLAQPPFVNAVQWEKIFLFFADERFVPHNDIESTYLLVRETLLDVAPIPLKNCFPMPTEGMTLEGAAASYQGAIETFFGATDDWAFDLAFLGMGPDGHTASLFPGRPDFSTSVGIVRDSPKPPPERLTLSLKAINRSRAVIFLVTGADKADRVREVLGDDGSDCGLPAARVEASGSATVWLLDLQSATGLDARLR